MERSRMALSRTVRAMGPAWSSEDAKATIPQREQRPYVGLIPTVPVKAAGWRIEPPVSVAVAPRQSLAATVAPEPPEEPPGTRCAPSMAPLSPAACTLEPLRRQGETTGPKALVSFDEPMANSSLLSLPSITAPSAQSCDVMVDSYCGSKPRGMFEPAVVTVPLVQNRFLMPSGTP